MKSLGLDVHSASFTLGVLTQRGQLVSCRSRTTSARNLIDAVVEVSGEKALVVEESHMAQWVKGVLEPFVDKLIICDPVRNSWIAKDDFNNDKTSAIKLARLYQDGYIKEIHHPDGEAAKLRRLFVHYYDLNQQLTRFKNKLKAVFRGQAIPTAGKSIYNEDTHEDWLKQLRGQSHLQHTARQRFTLIDTLENMKQETFEAMLKLARKENAFQLIDSVPGAGPLISIGYIALIETPHRFSRKNKLWRYAGFGLRDHRSDDVVYDKSASRSGNRILKWVVIEHFIHAVERPKSANRFKLQYEALLRRGMDSTAARRDVCRSLLTTVRALWIKEEAYRENPVR